MTERDKKIASWKKANTRQYLFYVNVNKYPCVADWLDAQTNKQQYLLGLVMEDMAINEETSESR